MKTTFFILLSALFINSGPFTASTESQDFQGKAYYFSKTTPDMSGWGNGKITEVKITTDKKLIETTIVLK